VEKGIMEETLYKEARKPGSGWKDSGALDIWIRGRTERFWGLDMREKAPEGRTERSGQDRWSAVNEEKMTGK
jgi:hypothetical protein